MLEIYKKLRAILTRREKGQFAYVLFAIVIMAILEVIGIASIMPFMQIVSQPDSVTQNEWLHWFFEEFGFEDVRAFMFAVGAAVLVLMTLAKVASVYTKWLQLRFVWNSAHSIATRLLSAYLRQPYEFFLQNDPTKLQKQVISEVHQLVREVLLPLVKLIAQGFVVVVVFTLLIAVDPQLAFIVFITLGGAYAIVYFTVRNYLFRLGKNRFRLIRLRFKTVVELFGSIKAVKISGCESYFVGRFTTVNRKHADIQPKYVVIAETPQSFIQLLAFGGILVILLYFLATEQNLQEIIPLLSLYALAGNRLMPSLQQVFTSASMLRYNYSVLDSIYEDLGMTSSASHLRLERAKREDDLPFERDIRLSGLTFRYHGSDEPVLKDVSLAIPKNTRVAFVGPTGSGKSTLVDVIMGLLQPSRGQVLVDGLPITPENVRQWQRMTGYVPQEVVLCDDTVMRNIAFGLENHKIDVERVQHVAKVARIHSFIMHELPDGYETKVGERGVRLSGGQQQRIGLARALYEDPAVLILDEATSALDGITEEAVMEAIAEVGHSMTIIMIAHRLSTVKNCDQIFLLEGGHVVAAGRYADLIETNLMFRGMARVAS